MNEIEPADQRLFTVDTETYDKLVAMLDRPAQQLPKLAALMRRERQALPETKSGE